MRRIGSFFVVLFISAGLLGGAANAGASTAGSVPTVKSLLGKGFVSVKATGNSAIGQRKLRVHFSGSTSKPRLTVQGGCNSWRAGFGIRKGRLFLKGQVSGTKMACSKDPDPWIRSRFRKGLKVRTSGNRLVLARPAEGVRFVFRQVSSKRVAPDPDGEVPRPEPSPRVTVPATKTDVDGKKYELIDTIGKKLPRGLELAFRDGYRTGAGGDVVPVSGMSFDGGCNHKGGDYAIEDGVLSWTNVVTTDMLCTASDDDWLYGFFSGRPEIGMDGSDLVFRKNGVELVLAQVAPDPEPRVTVPATKEDVDGRNYELTGSIGKKLSRGLKLGFRDGFKTDRNGTLVPTSGMGFDGGCNHMGGEYAIDDGTLALTEVVSTLMLCEGSDDDWLYGFLTGRPEIGLDGTDLVIRKGGVELQLRELPN